MKTWRRTSRAVEKNKLDLVNLLQFEVLKAINRKKQIISSKRFKRKKVCELVASDLIGKVVS